ncbi:MAG TPA: metal-sensitive transcriptional regulator [Actinomycetota bacterium]|nr:metal-sensitive transcriptional regulator [Actinomycetota bacterium]
MHGYEMNKKALQDRLRRIEGQVRGLQRMVDDDKYCIDILTQLSSVQAALRAVGMGVLDDHVRHCVRESIERGDAEAKIGELMAAVGRLAGR